MIVRKHLRWQRILITSRGFLTYIIVLSYVTYQFHVGQFKDYVPQAMGDFPQIPFSLVAALGTALAIFLGFRNNSAYDRWWEARKIWGGIVNISRTFTCQITSFTQLSDVAEQELQVCCRELVYRHLAWINALRLQLRGEPDWDEVRKLLDPAEFEWLLRRKNRATQLLHKQGMRLAAARRAGVLIDSHYHKQLDESLATMYDLQGRAERIKTTPLPRQYDYFPRVFFYMFVTMLPGGILTELEKVHSYWMVIPLATLVGFMFYALLRVGELNEAPFENRFTDTPLSALCRVIEIDLREQLGEDELPPPLQPVGGILM